MDKVTKDKVDNILTGKDEGQNYLVPIIYRRKPTLDWATQSSVGFRRCRSFDPGGIIYKAFCVKTDHKLTFSAF